MSTKFAGTCEQVFHRKVVGEGNTSHRVFLRLAMASLVCASAHAGTLVVRSQQGFQFIDAASITINGKDKALSLGSQPVGGGAASKRAAVHLAGTLLKDGDAGVLLEYESGNADYLLPQGLPKN
jgi:hypothetical protein